MSHTHSLSHSFLKSLTAAFLMVGIVTVSAATASAYQLKAAYGSVLVLRPAAPAVVPVTNSVLLLGMLIVLAGFLFHALFFLRYERPARRHKRA